jgi:hypothetical protein
MTLTSDVALLRALAAEAQIWEAREAFRFVTCGDSGMPTEDRQQAQRSRSPAPGALRGAAQVSAHWQQAMQGGQPQSTRLNRSAIASLQRAAGNRAVSGLLGRRRANYSAVQREIENMSFRAGITDDDKKKTEAFFHSINTAVAKAHKFVISVPSLGAWHELDGHTKDWRKKWDGFLAGERPKLMAATFGYVIESLVSNNTTDFSIESPTNCSILTQVTYGGTRPDLVLKLKKRSADIAWADLTASESVDHIFAKEGWRQKVGTFAEVTYPSLDAASLALMVQNKDNEGELTDEEFKKRQEAARAAYKMRKQHWIMMGREKYSAGQHKDAFKGKRLLIELNPSLKQPIIKDILEKDFNAEIDLRMIPSVLKAMGLDAKAWGFDTGFSESERAGEAWLVDHDPTLPSAEEASEKTTKTPTKKYTKRYKPY